jgi:hypothetical protein
MSSRPAMRPTQSPILWMPRPPSLGVKQPGRESGHSSPSSAEVPYINYPISLRVVALNQLSTGTTFTEIRRENLLNMKSHYGNYSTDMIT